LYSSYRSNSLISFFIIKIYIYIINYNNIDNNSSNSSNKNIELINLKDKKPNKRIKTLLSPFQHLSLSNVYGKNSSRTKLNNLSRSSLVSVNSDTTNHNIEKKKEKLNKKEYIPCFSLAQSIDPSDDHSSKSQFFEDLSDYVEKNVDENSNLSVHSTYTKLNTIPYHTFQTQDELLNIMNENRSKLNYLKIYSSRSVRTSSSEFFVDSSSESIKDKSEYIIWNKNLNIERRLNNLSQANNDDSDEDENDPFEDISDLSVSSFEREQHLSKY